MPDAVQQLRDRVRALRTEFESALGGASDLGGLQALRDRFLGRRAGAVTDLMKSLGSLPAEARPQAGQELNALKDELESRLESARSSLEEAGRSQRLARERLDVTLPGRLPAVGHRHLLTATREALEDIFLSMGYEVYDVPEVDDDFHCFEALNMPPDHPARDMQDTFYLKDQPGLLLRTHTSTGQIRYMLDNPHPPHVRIICPGKVYRRDDDITHSPMFQQIEGLVLGPGITVGDLVGTVEAFLHALFGPQYPVRLRASYFPYTEPSVEFDLGCVVCQGKGCRLCKQTGWLEIMGSGMVHPAVFEAVNARLGRVVYDPEEVTGFAFGLGIERVAMVRHGVDDIRLFYGGDLRFLEQFPVKVPLSWLKEFVEVPVEPARLAEDLTRAGLAVDAVETDGTDAVLDLDITTNRVDCMNVYGVAREVSVVYDRPLRPLELSISETDTAGAEAWSVEVESPDLCPRFCGRVLEIKMGPSPGWIRERLEKVGVRPISNVVDLTNYVMMEMGHPSHAFDLAKVPGGRMRIRWARAGERLTTLDGTERVLHPGVGLVAGEEAPLALAGIMGGAKSEVSEDTRLVALEAAYWEPLAIRRAAKSLGMHTEASHRFERGADPEGAPSALARIGHLLEKTGAGRVRRGLIDHYVARRPARSAVLRPARASAVLGVDVPEATASRILAGLGFSVGEREGAGRRVGIPTWRGDVSREVDLVEEVGRHHGLDKIPATVPATRGAVGLRPWQVRERLIREVMVGSGLTEVISYAFVPATTGGTVALQNPLSEEQAILRRSLVWPGLVRTLDTNQRQGRREVRVFEVGRVFLPGSARLVEERHLGLLVTGAGHLPHWSDARPRRDVDFFDATGLLELLSRRLGREPFRYTAGGVEEAFVHPGRSAVVWDGERRLGWVAALHPDQTRSEVYVAEIALDRLLTDAPPPARARPLPRFPAVSRDLSVLWAAEGAAEALLARVRRAGGPLLQSAAVTDRYEGPPVPPGKVSLTLTLVFQDPARTLTGEDVQTLVEAAMSELRQAGAEIRSE